MSGVNRSDTCLEIKDVEGGNQVPAVLAVGGHDPSGGAGLTVDSCAIRAGGGHPLTIPASLTCQNGLEFAASYPAAPEFISASWHVLIDVFDIRAVKTGALANAQNVVAVASLFRELCGAYLVVDPVMQSTSGGRLLDDAARGAMVEKLFGLADLVTPNLAEARALTGRHIEDVEDMERAAERLLCLGPRAVLLKGGHLRGEAKDLYLDSSGHVEVLVAPRTRGVDPRGTGCALASFIAVAMARKMSTLDACRFAKREISAAVEGAVRCGRGPHLLCIR